MTLLCQVFRSPKRAQMYLYVDKSRGLQDVPETLLGSFGEPEEVMTLALTPERRLARADAAEVISNIREQGYYLQMPPTPEKLRRAERVGEGTADRGVDSADG
jgi:uncharacterized protein YcgL (UPF0745 family)